MTVEHGSPGLSEIEKLALESTQHLKNIREKGGDKAWATEMGSFLIRATSVLGSMGRKELVAQIYINMEEDLSVLYSDPVLARAFVLGAVETAKLIGFEFKLNNPELFPKTPEGGE